MDTAWLDEAPDAHWLDEAPDEKPKPEKPSTVARAAKWAGETAADAIRGAGGLVDQAVTPVVATAGALGSYAVPYTSGHFFDPAARDLGPDATFAERWQGEAGAWRGAREKSQQRSPTAYTVGSVLPLALAPQAMAGMPSLTSALPATTRAANVGARALGGALDSAAYSAAAAGLGNVDRDPLGAAGEAASSPANLLGAALPLAGAALPQVRASVRSTADKLLRRNLPRLVPTPAARELMDRGVKLTVGQMDPDSALAHVEEASAERFGGMAPERRAAAKSWRQAVLQQGLPPGMPEVPEGAIQDQLAQIYEGFEPAYNRIRGEHVLPAVKGPNGSQPLQSFEIRTKTADGRGSVIQAAEPGAFELALQDPTARARDSDVSIVKRFLDHELSLLPGGVNRPAKPEPVEAGTLLQMRSHIGKAAQAARLEGRPEQARLLEGAQDAVTKALDSQLQPEAQAHLRATDRQYGQYRTLEAASGRQTAGGQEGEFTPYQLEAEIRAGTGRPAFARGAGGELRALGHAGNAVLGARVPQTGWRATLLDQLPGQKWIPGGLLSRAANAQPIRDALLRLPPAPAVQSLPARGAIGAAVPQVFRSELDPVAALVAALRAGPGDQEQRP